LPICQNIFSNIGKEMNLKQLSKMENKDEKNAMKILLAMDDAAHSKVVLKKVAGRPYPPNTKVHIVSAYETTPLLTTIEPMGVRHEYYAEADRNALKSAENNVEKATKILHTKNPSLIITTAVVEGKAKRIILEEAEKFGADLIIVGSHSYGAVERFLLGSVSHAVALHAKCSVEIVR
jgi:nucleotide-binding universal stress UspA family protein